MSVKVTSVVNGSPADKKGITAEDKILTVNGNEIIDVLDYRFYQNEKRLNVQIETKDGKVKTLKIHKGEYEDLGLQFETYLMDKQKSCKNKCIFCFIDQLPKGMRESLYFKDDDSRLSFLFGNYITLTNLTEHEIERIIKMHISPVNISVHTTNPELREKMMNNRFAGESLAVIKRFNDAGIKMNCQLVLCPNINDGDELKRTLDDLTAYENVVSVAAVPVGITKYREGLFPLTSYDKKTALETVEILENYGEKCKQKFGERKVFASDEFYLTAEREIPECEFYEDFSQLENGVGMWALFKDDVLNLIRETEFEDVKKKITVITGVSAYPLIKFAVEKVKEKWHNLDCGVYAVKNNFFGEKITVAGLVTGQDIIEQLKGKELGEYLVFPSVMLRYENDMFLDDTTVSELEEALNIKTVQTDSTAESFVNSLIYKGE